MAKNERTWGRFGRYTGGAVPQNVEQRTSEQQLAHLDQCGLVAKKERAKLAKRIAEAAKKAPKKG